MERGAHEFLRGAAHLAELLPVGPVTIRYVRRVEPIRVLGVALIDREHDLAHTQRPATTCAVHLDRRALNAQRVPAAAAHSICEFELAAELLRRDRDR